MYSFRLPFPTTFIIPQNHPLPLPLQSIPIAHAIAAILHCTSPHYTLKSFVHPWVLGGALGVSTGAVSGISLQGGLISGLVSGTALPARPTSVVFRPCAIAEWAQLPQIIHCLVPFQSLLSTESGLLWDLFLSPPPHRFSPVESNTYLGANEVGICPNQNVSQQRDEP
ncbi:hypothetical protein FJTKL_04211 [Diaporthe vaccinii]|uniref:Uncharacterized protein n=1 Tax=Diaporthe vaccinii TaxID=105482 RepID=A0ABR4DT89_9PEZI